MAVVEHGDRGLQGVVAQFEREHEVGDLLHEDRLRLFADLRAHRVVSGGQLERHLGTPHRAHTRGLEGGLRERGPCRTRLQRSTRAVCRRHDCVGGCFPGAPSLANAASAPTVCRPCTQQRQVSCVRSTSNADGVHFGEATPCPQPCVHHDVPAAPRGAVSRRRATHDAATRAMAALSVAKRPSTATPNTCR